MSIRPSHVSWLTWQIWGLEGLRSRIIATLLDAGIPALALVPVSELPGFIDGAEYGSKMRFHAAPLFVLEQAEYDAQRWLN